MKWTIILSVCLYIICACKKETKWHKRNNRLTPITDFSAVISIPALKFQDYEGSSRLKASTAFQNYESQSEMVFNNDEAQVPLINITLNRRNKLTIFFYADEEHIFTAIKEVEFLKDKETLRLANCRIVPANWDGIKDQGNCNWKIEASN